MQKNTLDDYKAGIKAKYEEEKLGDYNSFLVQPSRARLRDLCVLILRDSNNRNDHQTFHRFFGFEYNIATQRQLKDTADKFRPIETFFKNETDLTDINAVDISAFLVNFNPRPFAKFLKNDGEEKLDYSIKEEPILQVKDSIKLKRIAVMKQLPKKSFTIKQLIKAVLIILTVFLSGFGIKNYFSPEKQCMLWQKNHYEVVDCATENAIPIDNNALDLKKIEVNAKTVFFKNNKPLIWYWKVGGKPEFFNKAGTHPEKGKILKPITKYMIEKYVEK